MAYIKPSALERIVREIKTHPRVFIAGAVGLGLMAGTVIALNHPSNEDNHEDSDLSEFLVPFSRPIFTPEDLREKPDRDKTAAALSGGSERGLAYGGFLYFLDKHGIYIDDFYSGSAGTIGAVPYVRLRQMYTKNPDVFNGLSPAQELIRRFSQVGGRLLRSFSVREQLNRRGFVDTSNLDNLLYGMLESANFNETPGLYVIAYDPEFQRNVVFGRERNETTLLDAAKSSMSIVGLIAPHNRLIDGCVLGKAPVEELYSENYGLSIVIFLGYHEDPMSVFFGNEANHKNPIRQMRAKFVQYDREVRTAIALREKRDFQRFVLAKTGMTVEEYNEKCNTGDTGLVIVLPDTPNTNFAGRNNLKALIMSGYNATRDAWLRYHGTLPEPIPVKYVPNLKKPNTQTASISGPYTDPAATI